MDFEALDFITFFKDHLPAALDAVELSKPDVELPVPAQYLNDVPNTLNSNNIVLYLDDDTYTQSAWTNDSRIIKGELTVYIVIKGLKDLKAIAKRYAEAITNLIRENTTMAGTVDHVEWTEVRYADGVEGLTQVKGVRIVLEYEVEK